MSVPRLLEQAGCPEHLLDGPIGDIIAIDPLVVHKRTSVIVTTLHAESIGARAKNAVADWETSVPLDWNVETIEEIPAP